MEKGRVTTVLGLQRGDEGKGRIVDALARHHDIVARYNGGPNAGHSVVLPSGQELITHQLPSGVSYKDKVNIISDGSLLDPIGLLQEIYAVNEMGIPVSEANLFIGEGAALIVPAHQILDHRRESGTVKQGSTRLGIAYAAADKYRRMGMSAELLKEDPEALLRLVYAGLCQALPNASRFSNSELARFASDWVRAASEIAPYITDSQQYLKVALASGKSVLAEGAQAFWLDVDQGARPLTTSSHTNIGGAMNGLGIPPHYFERVVGVCKLVESHVGEGPFPTEITPDSIIAKRLRGEPEDIDGEFGSTTGRPRRVGPPDLVKLRKAVYVNGVSELALTKMDHVHRFGNRLPIAINYKYRGRVISEAPSSARKLAECQPVYKEMPLWNPEINIGDIDDYDELPPEARDIVETFEQDLGVRVSMIGTGPARQQLISRQ